MTFLERVACIPHVTRDLVLFNSAWTRKVRHDNATFVVAFMVGVVLLPFAALIDRPLEIVTPLYINRLVLVGADFLLSIMYVWGICVLAHKTRCFDRVFAGLVYIHLPVGVLYVFMGTLDTYLTSGALPTLTSLLVSRMLWFLASIWLLALAAFVFKSALRTSAIRATLLAGLWLFALRIMDIQIQAGLLAP